MEGIIEDKSKMEEENFERLVQSAEKEHEFESMHQELKMSKEYLKDASQKNDELQVRILPLKHVI